MEISDLPLEILVEILTYLPVDRRQSASWRINCFYEASTHPRFKNDFRLNLRAAHLDENTDPVQVFEGSHRVFGEVVFYDTTFGNGYEDFLEGICKFAETISLKYKCRKVETKNIVAVIGSCCDLKTLSIELDEGFAVILNASDKEKTKIRQGLKTIEHLKISGPIEARIESFVEFLDWMPKLKVLDLRNLDVFRSEERQFYDALLPYIERHSATLKGILFEKDYKPENLEKYKRLVQMSDLCLTQFAGTALQNWKWSEAEYDCFRKFLQSKCKLDELRLNTAQQLEWGHLIEIIKEQKNLKRLEVDNFSFFPSVEAGLLHLLPKIESIVFRDSMDHQHQVWPLVNEENLVPAINYTLKELVISKFYGLYTPVWLNCEYRALTRLEIRDCELEDEHVHLICEKLPKLVDFTITSPMITDFAITGRPRRKSKAQTEKLKTAIVDLHQLKYLALDYDSITKEAFEELKLVHLQNLSLEGCERINHAAILNIVSNCPNIEVLNVNYCNKLKDESIEAICKGLRKLRRLKINELPAVTEKVFEKIGNASNLRYLHMKDYVKIKNRHELASYLFKQLQSLKIVKLGVRQEIHRNDVFC
ncbi:uncharacterized protein LOC134828013 [Culicoides brevitarsis]|uniref:uncharacterized protein LOC134828013 n=1 Tax=Culicoides brevitarsis TaxID=469753 RepID=UPI00307BC2E0